MQQAVPGSHQVGSCWSWRGGLGSLQFQSPGWPEGTSTTIRRPPLGYAPDLGDIHQAFLSFTHLLPLTVLLAGVSAKPVPLPCLYLYLFSHYGSNTLRSARYSTASCDSPKPTTYPSAGLCPPLLMPIRLQSSLTPSLDQHHQATHCYQACCTTHHSVWFFAHALRGSRLLDCRAGLPLQTCFEIR